jgi:hypothetical protein
MCSINGFIEDNVSGERLIGCYVFDSASMHGIVTNSFGYFNLLLNEGNNTIVSYYLGYAKQTLTVGLKKDTTIIIKLSAAKPTEINEVKVVNSKYEANLTKPQMSLLNMSNKDIKEIPVLLGETDVMRAIQIMPGIQAANERSTGLSVRGGSIDQNLFLLDDAPVYQISHIAGFYSVFNADAVKDIKVYKGDMPANYGGRLASVVDIRLKDGNMQNYVVTGGIGLIASDLSIEGPIVKDRVSFILSGKYSYTGLLYSRINSNINLNFYDLNCKINAIINNKNRIYISSYNGSDNAHIGINSNYQNNTLSMRWNHIYGSKLFSNVSLIYSNFNFKTGTDYLNYTWNSGIKQVTLKVDNNFYINNNNTIDFGASTAYKDFMPGKLEGSQTAIDSIEKSNNSVIGEQGCLDHAIYISELQKISDKLSLKYGVRVNLYQDLGGHWVYKLNNYQVADSFYAAKNRTYTNYYSVEPRIGINYRVSQNSAIKASYTYTSQQDQLLIKTNGGGPLDIWFPSDNNIKPQTSSQYNLGYDHFLFDNLLEISIEGYYKNMKNIIDYKDGATFLQNSSMSNIDQTTYNFEEQLRIGKGYAYGTELMLKGEFNKIDGFISYTYARSKRIIPDINNGNVYLSPFDKPNTFDAFLNFNVTKRVSFSANFRYQSGQVTTVPVYTVSLFGMLETGYSNRNEYRLPYYQRLDLSMIIKNKEIEGKHYHSEWNFSIVNVLNHHDVAYVDFSLSNNNPDIINAKGTYILGFMPSVSYHFNF